MKIAFLTEMGFTGKIPANHPNMRTEFAWFFALNADHYNIGDFPRVSGYDWVFLILPKGGVSLNSEGIRLNTEPNRYSELYKIPFVEHLKSQNKKVAFVQEGPSWYVNDFSILDQFNFYNQLAECDVIFAHNSSDMKWYSGWFPGKKVTTMPTLMIEELIQSISPITENKAIIGGNFCFTPNTRILMGDGHLKNIKDIKTNDKVLVRGKRYSVIHKFERDINENIIEITTFGNRKIQCTSNHNLNGVFRKKHVLWNGKRQQPVDRYKIYHSEIEEIPSGKLSKGDFLLIPKFAFSGINKYPDDLMWLFGFWLAEGSIESRPDRKNGTGLGRIQFSIHRNENLYAERIKYTLKKYYSITNFSDTIRKNTNSRVISCSNQELAKHLKNTFGVGALNKQIPFNFLWYPNILVLLQGLFSGDGCFYRNKTKSNSYSFTTGSKKLGDDVSIILDSVGIRHSKTYSTSKLSSTIFTKISIFNKIDINKIGGEKVIEFIAKDRCTQYIHSEGILVPIKKITSIPYKGKIYNIEVETINKYITSGILVNNCRWYGGFQSYLCATEFEVPIYVQTSHASQPGEDQVPNLNILPRLVWVEWIKALSSFKYAVHLMPTAAAGTFNLNCAYFGIPCIGNIEVDTQKLCHPSLSVQVYDINTARQLAQLLKEDPVFYKKCSEEAKNNYRKYYSLDKWKEKVYSIIYE
jgi:intein/homing endonuclease